MGSVKNLLPAVDVGRKPESGIYIPGSIVAAQGVCSTAHLQQLRKGECSYDTYTPCRIHFFVSAGIPGPRFNRVP